MRFHNATEIDNFIEAINQCSGSVWLESIYHDKYMLNSKFSQYLALAKLLSEHGDELELFTQLPEDRARLIRFFQENPEVN